jgi:hypothetical protein
MAPSTEAKAKEILAKLEEAQRIVNEYGGVIMSTAKLYYGAPASLLPHSKERIKSAILQTALGLHLLKKLDQVILKRLRDAYIYLAEFIPDPEAQRAARFAAALSSGDLQRIADSSLEKTLTRSRAITLEMVTLAAEFDALIAKNRILSWDHPFRMPGLRAQ